MFVCLELFVFHAVLLPFEYAPLHVFATSIFANDCWVN